MCFRLKAVFSTKSRFLWQLGQDVLPESAPDVGSGSEQPSEEQMEALRQLHQALLEVRHRHDF